MNFASFDLNLLRVLDALLREGSTVRAGRRIGLSQPAVSAALGRLRHALGDDLFHRRGQGLEPTDFAASLAEPLSETLEKIERLLSPPCFDPTRAAANFRLSGSDFFAEMLMPRLANLLSHEAPGIRVQLVDLVPDNHVDTLDRYEVDLALVPYIDGFPDWVDAQDLFRSRFVVIARTGHPRLARARVAPGAVVPIDLFCDIPQVLFSQEGKLKAMGDAALAAVGRERRVAMTLPVFSGVYRAVASSDYIALLPVQLARAVAESAGLSLYEAPIPIEPARIVAVWHRRATGNPAHAWLRGRIAEILGTMSDP